MSGDALELAMYSSKIKEARDRGFFEPVQKKQWAINCEEDD